jgi:hypothetical protein
MSKLANLVHTLGAIQTEFDLDLLDLKLLVASQERWDEGRDIRITDLVQKYSIASPATIHYRISRDLVGKKMIALKSNPEDMREKFIVRGSKFKTLEKFLGD